jgi:hypothetical protein
MTRRLHETLTAEVSHVVIISGAELLAILLASLNVKSGNRWRQATAPVTGFTLNRALVKGRGDWNQLVILIRDELVWGFKRHD